MSNSMEPVLLGLYVEKVGDNWRINHPDGTCFDGPFKSKGAATRALTDWKSEAASIALADDAFAEASHELG